MNKFLRLFLPALLSILAVPELTAETHYRPHISVGAHGGATLSRMSFSPEVPQTWKTGTLFGLHVRYAEEKLVGVLGEINFVNRGWKETFEENPEYSYSRTLTYIAVPLMTHIAFGSPRMKFFVNLGPEFAFMIMSGISSNFDYSKAASLLPSTRRVNQMSMAIKNKFDYGITAGIGGEFYLTPRNSLYVEGRFYYGLGNIFSATKSDEFSASRTMTIGITAGYNFRLH